MSNKNDTRRYFLLIENIFHNLNKDERSDFEKSDLLDALSLMMVSKRLEIINRIKQTQWQKDEDSAENPLEKEVVKDEVKDVEEE